MSADVVEFPRRIVHVMPVGSSWAVVTNRAIQWLHDTREAANADAVQLAAAANIPCRTAAP